MNLNLPFNIDKCQFLQRDELKIAVPEIYFEPNRPAYLYGILSKNRISINQDSVKFSDQHIEVEFQINDKGKLNKELLRLEHNYKELKEVKVITEYPYNEFKIVDEDGSNLINGKTAYFLEHPLFYEQIRNKDLLDYELLYIGQSVRSKDNVPVLKRTTAHSTLRKILEDYNRTHIDKEVFLFFFSFKQSAVIEIVGNETRDERNQFAEKFIDTYKNPTKEKIRHNVSILEAALINYFRPFYNDKFTKVAPNKGHKSFKMLNEMNLNKVNILFGVEDFRPRIYTETSGRKSEYSIEYTIESPSKKSKAIKKAKKNRAADEKKKET